MKILLSCFTLVLLSFAAFLAQLPSHAVPFQIYQKQSITSLDQGALPGALQRGQFTQVLLSAQSILVSRPLAPIHGLAAVAAAALDDHSTAERFIDLARSRSEPRADFYQLTLEAMILRANGQLEGAAAKALEAIRRDSRNSLPHLTLGWVRFEQNKLDLAENQARQALAIEPELAAAFVILGAVAFNQGKLDQAQAAYDRAQNIDPADLRPKIGLAEVFFASKRYPAALQLSRLLLQLKPDLHATRELLARTLIDSNDPSAAIPECAILIRAEYKLPSSIMLLAVAEARDHQPAAAIETLAKLSPDHEPALQAYLAASSRLALGDLESARELFKKAGLEPRFDREALSALAIVEHLAGNYEEAERAFRTAAFQAPNSLSPILHFSLANLRLSQRRWEEARAEMAQAGQYADGANVGELDLAVIYAQVSPASSACLNQSLFFLDRGFQKTALAILEKSILSNAHDPIALMIVASLYDRENQPEKSLVALKTLTTIFPRYTAAHMNLGELQMRQNRPVEAIQSFATASRIDPRNAAALLRIATLQTCLKNFPEAEIAFLQVIALQPSCPIPYNELAFIWSEETSKLAKAVTFAEKAVSLAPKNPALLDTLGWVYLKSDRAKEAASQFENALRCVQSPASTATVLYHLALALHKLGDNKGALDSIQKALLPSIDFPEVNAARSLAVTLAP